VNRYNNSPFDGCLIPALCLLIFICFMLSFMGCATTKYVPKIEYQEVLISQPCIIYMDIPPRPFYESFPELGGDSKEWALEVERVVQANRAKREAYIESLLFLVEEHNRLEPQCSP